MLGWKMLGLERSVGSRIVTYADDFVILCRRGKAEEALRRLREIMGPIDVVDGARSRRRHARRQALRALDLGACVPWAGHCSAQPPPANRWLKFRVAGTRYDPCSIEHLNSTGTLYNRLRAQLARW